MSLTENDKKFAKKVLAKYGQTCSPKFLRFCFKTYNAKSISEAQAEELINNFKSPPVTPNLTPLVVNPSRRRSRDMCTSIINDLKKEISGLDQRAIQTNLTDSGLSPILCLSDLHFGEVIEVNGTEIFNIDIARDAFNSVIAQAILAPELSGYEVDEIVVLLAGDIVDGELIFPAQGYETDGDVYSQLKIAVEIIWAGLLKLAEEFPSVSVYCVPGNHGRSSRLHSQMSNWDNALYFSLSLLAGMSDVNIQVVPPHQMWMDFKVRDWNVHTRHIGVSQAATPSPAKKVKTWMENHAADLFFYGHYHNPEMYSHGYKRIFKNGSLPPANEFAERLGFEDSTGQWMVGVTDSNPFSFMKVLVPKFGDLDV